MMISQRKVSLTSPCTIKMHHCDDHCDCGRICVNNCIDCIDILHGTKYVMNWPPTASRHYNLNYLKSEGRLASLIAAIESINFCKISNINHSDNIAEFILNYYISNFRDEKSTDDDIAEIYNDIKDREVFTIKRPMKSSRK